MNRIEVTDKWFNAITSYPVDEHVNYDYKGQYYGFKIYEADSSIEGIPEEYLGTWKCNMMWGDMCGDMNQESLIRVTKKVIMKPHNTWVEEGEV